MNDAGRIVGLLSDPVRRRAFAAVVLGARSPGHVAAMADLDPRVAERALIRLVDGGVLDREDGVLDVAGDLLTTAAREAGMRARALEPPPAPGPLRPFLKEGRLTAIPTKRVAQEAVLDLLLERFADGEEYPEKVVNAIIAELHPDYATLRRMLVDTGRLTREAGIYRRVPR